MQERIRNMIPELPKGYTTRRGSLWGKPAIYLRRPSGEHVDAFPAGVHPQTITDAAVADARKRVALQRERKEDG